MFVLGFLSLFVVESFQVCIDNGIVIKEGHQFINKACNGRCVCRNSRPSCVSLCPVSFVRCEPPARSVTRRVKVSAKCYCNRQVCQRPIVIKTPLPKTTTKRPHLKTTTKRPHLKTTTKRPHPKNTTKRPKKTTVTPIKTRRTFTQRTTLTHDSNKGHVPKGGEINLTTIIAVSVVGVVLIIIAVIICCVCLIRKRNNESDAQEKVSAAKTNPLATVDGENTYQQLAYIDISSSYTGVMGKPFMTKRPPLQPPDEVYEDVLQKHEPYVDLNGYYRGKLSRILTQENSISQVYQNEAREHLKEVESDTSDYLQLTDDYSYPKVQYVKQK